MIKNKNKIGGSESEPDGIKMNHKESSLAEFTQRPLPTEQQVEEFEEVIKEEAEEEEKEEEIEESLSEIYQDDNGDMVDVKKLTIKKRRGLFYWFSTFLFIVSLLAGGIYIAYNYYFLNSGTDPTALDFIIEGESEVLSGEDYFYTLTYNNRSNAVITNARIEVGFPDNFILLDSYPEPKGEKNNVWEIFSIPAESSNRVKIKGMMIGAEGDTGIVVASIHYMPENFSSEFTKEVAFSTKVKSTGMEIDISYISTALVGEENDISVHFNAKEDTFVNSFRVSIEPQENVEFLNAPDTKIENLANFTNPRIGVWQINEIARDEAVLPIFFKFTQKVTSRQEMVIKFEKAVDSDSYYVFHEEKLNFEVLKSDLNLTLIINGSREDQGVNFGSVLNYSIVYQNKGETEMKDVIIMAVLDSGFLDWTTLQDVNNGQEKGNTIAWTKTSVPALASLVRNAEGTIDFSIEVMDVTEVEPGQDYQAKSYAQFSIGELAEGEKPAASEDNRSNAIINKINSDLKLIEEVRYFSADNETVGNGPLPLKVGEPTSFKVYWTITNNLHELTDAKVEASLPNNVVWDEKNRTNVGSINYDSENRKVVWDIGRLPITVFRADAEFNFRVTPTEDDLNKIIVLKPGSRITALDNVTDTEIIQITNVKTSKLEDDEIAQRTNDGIVRN